MPGIETPGISSTLVSNTVTLQTELSLHIATRNLQLDFIGTSQEWTSLCMDNFEFDPRV
ncbi:hypothetical protein PILCRDRAFT_822794 [Piloderma croceum F 1598]|uniref:Uncharacterized protein n=1 Tax=Piloderma croceum (strain F 1598) TaxID=765440 RepID=A0A0C3EZ98_PILCF|nr:hypothetical protein PILCRDRAFT_829417 [Piloderma croceum F 1598]KIM79925.1 hypothetical protein PILCRDRAFT_822794 [Piloderma croceum F 1598]